MNLIYRNINIEKDRDYILERHCRINYESDTLWARKKPYEEYSKEWFAQDSQVNDFLHYLVLSMNDDRTIAQIVENEVGEKMAYLWVRFHKEARRGFCFAEVQDIYVEEAFRKQGIALLLMKYAEDKARANGAKVIRSATGCENYKSKKLHDKMGYYTFMYEFEKIL